MHENAPMHTAAVTEDFLEQHVIEPITWRPYSLELNPIEFM